MVVHLKHKKRSEDAMVITFKQQLDKFEREWDSLLDEHEHSILIIKQKIKEQTKLLETLDEQFERDSDCLTSEYKEYCEKVEAEKNNRLASIAARFQEELASLDRRHEDARTLRRHILQEQMDDALRPIDEQVAALDAELSRLQKRYEEALSSSSEDAQRIQKEFSGQINLLEDELNALAEKLIQIEYNVFIESLDNTDSIVLATSSLKDKISHVFYQKLQVKEELKLHSTAQPIDVQFTLQELSDFQKRYQLLRPHLLVERERIVNESQSENNSDIDEAFKQEKEEICARYKIMRAHFVQIQAESNEYEQKLSKLKEKYESERSRILGSIERLQLEIESENEDFAGREEDFIAKTKETLDGLLKSDFDLSGHNVSNATLPEAISIGGIPNRVDDSKLLKRMYGVSSVESVTPINIELRSDKCNIVIDVDEDADDEGLNRIVAGLALKYLEKFPLGTLKIGLVDMVGVDCLRPLIFAFQDAAVPLAKQMARDGYVRDDGKCKTYFEQLSRTIDEELYRKVLSGDIYTAFADDPTGTQMHLIIIRAGMFRFSEQNNGFILDKIAEFSRSSKYGVRFIIINSAKKECRAMNDIYSHALRFTYHDKKILQDGKEVILTAVRKEEVFTAVQDECKVFVNAIIEKAKEVAIIPHERVGFGSLSAENMDEPQIAIDIPIGLIDGKMPFSMEFDCKAINGRGIICYTVLGKTNSGKSSLLHSMVINGCMKYSPNDLIFWLFDFKATKTANEYRSSRIPHIQFVQEGKENNPHLVSDLYNLLRLVAKEMSRRSKIIAEAKKIAEENGVAFKEETIADYNFFIDHHPEILARYPGKGFHHIPRLIIAFDEPNQVYRMTNSSGYKEIDDMYARLTTQIRINGIHFVHFVHTVREGSYQGSYVKNAQGKICFAMEDETALSQELRGMGEEFASHQHEIIGLPVGECYAKKFDSSTLQRVKICFAPNGLNEYKEKIVQSSLNRDFPSNILVIGQEDYLLSSDEVQTERTLTQAKFMHRLASRAWEVIDDFSRENDFACLIGEDCYTLKPITIDFNSSDMGGLAICGKNDLLQYSIFSSLLIQTYAFGFETHICLSKPNTNFGKLCSKIGASYHKIEEFTGEIEAVYAKYIDRKAAEAQGDAISKEPIFVFIGDLNGLLNSKATLFETANVMPNEEQATPQYVAQNTGETIAQVVVNSRYSANNKFPDRRREKSGQAKAISCISLQKAVEEIAKLGAQQGIYLVVGANGAETASVLLHPSIRIVFVGQMDGQKDIMNRFNSNYDLKLEIQNTVSEAVSAQSFAVLASQTDYTKFRPIVYRDMPALTRTIEEVKNG